MMDASRFSLGLGGGANGGVVEGAYEVSPQWVLRAQGAYIDFSHAFDSNDVHYQGRLKFETGGAFADWHPFSNPWLISGGYVDGQRRVNVTATAAGTGYITIHGVTYSVTQVGAVNGDVNFGDGAPVASFGWDNTYYGAHHLGFRALLGVQFGEHPPATSLYAVGPYASNPSVVSELQAEQQSLRHDAANFSYYPVAQVALTYRF